MGVPSDKIKIILLDDNPDDRILVKRELEKVLPNMELLEVRAPDELESALRSGNCDLVITDFQLRWTTGTDVLARLKKERPTVPIVMFTGTGNEEIAVASLKAGLDDYIPKKPENYSILARTVKNLLQVQTQKEEILRVERFYKNLFDSVPIGLYITSPERRFQDINQAMVKMFRFPDKETMKAIDTRELYAHPEDQDAWRRAIQEKGVLLGTDIEFRRYDGTTFWGRETSRVVREESRIIRYEGSIEDITEKKKAEEQLKQSEALYRATVNQAREAIFLVDVQSKKIFKFNPAFQEMLGYSSEEMLSLTVYNYVGHHPDDIDEMCSRILDKKAYFIGERKYRRKDGSLIDVEVSTHLVTLDNRDAIAIVARDISERKRMEAEREQYLERIRIILDAIPEGIILLDEDLTILLINPLAETYIDLIGEVDSQNRLLRLNNQPIENFLKPLVDRPYYEVKLDRPDARIFEIENSVVVNHTEKREWVLVIRDVTRERAMQMIIEGHQRMAAVGQLAGGIAHDFNNLLTAIQGYSELLMENPQLDQDAIEDLQEIRHATERASVLIRHLLAFSRKQMMKPEVINLNTFLFDLEPRLKRILENNIAIKFNLDDRISPVRIDPGQLERVVINIVLNAREAMPDGGELIVETSMVELRAEDYHRYVGARPGRYVKMTLRDTGVGMEERVRRRVFEPFFTTKSRFQKAGLGLSTAYGIIKQSNGYIWVDSRPGEGAAFHIFLPPVDKPLPKRIDQKEDRERLKGSETILVVEDEDMVRALSRSVLDRFGYTVIEAANAEAAERLLEEYTDPIHLAIIDIFMPGTGGIELARRIRKQRGLTRFLFVSGYFDTEKYVEDISRLGGNLLPKPFSPIQLVSKIRDILDAKSV